MSLVVRCKQRNNFIRRRQKECQSQITVCLSEVENVYTCVFLAERTFSGQGICGNILVKKIFVNGSILDFARTNGRNRNAVNSHFYFTCSLYIVFPRLRDDIGRYQFKKKFSVD
jgi:hypothetical protein